MSVSTASLHCEKLPPQSLEAERGLLGSLLLWADALDDVAEILSADGAEFYADAHRRIYRAIRDVRQAGIGVDAITVAEQLEQHCCLEEIGGPAYLFDLLEAVPHAAHAKYYAGIIAERSARRNVISAATLAIGRAFDESLDVDEVLGGAESALHEVIEQRLHGTGASTDLTQILFEVFEKLETGNVPGLPIGYPDVQEKLGGWFPGNLVIVAARPGMGKSALAVNLARLSAQCGTGVYFASLEMTRLELAERLLSIESGLSAFQLRKCELTPEERQTALAAATPLQTLPILIDEASPRTVAQIAASARLCVRKHGVKLVIVDYLQLVSPENRREHREQQVSQISRDLKALAKSLGVTVIALAQLNREIEKRVNKKPQLSDLRESGAIEQDADLVLFVDRPGEYDPSKHPGLAQLIVAKHRNGAPGEVKLVWRAETMEFLSAAPDWLAEFENFQVLGE